MGNTLTYLGQYKVTIKKVYLRLYEKELSGQGKNPKLKVSSYFQIWVILF